MKLLVSACLLGCRCRYDGAAKPHPAMEALAERHTLVPVCPEQLGGLSTPRPPAERQGDRVVTERGADVTEQYCRGAAEAAHLCTLLGCQAAVLKERSPSCGKGQVYDGRSSCGDGHPGLWRIPGRGAAEVTAAPPSFSTIFAADFPCLFGRTALAKRRRGLYNKAN